MTTLTQARSDRDTGMARAAEAEDRSETGFADALYAAIVAVAKRQATVHFDDVNPLLTVRPLHFNASGSVWLRAIKDGVIVATGRTRPCATDRRKRAHNSPVYRSTLFGRAAVATAPGRPASPQPAPVPSRQIDLFAEGAR